MKQDAAATRVGVSQSTKPERKSDVEPGWNRTAWYETGTKPREPAGALTLTDNRDVSLAVFRAR